LIFKNGERRIIDLIMPGDFIGPVAGDARLCHFEASIDDTSTAFIAGRDLSALAAIRPFLYRFFHERACQTIARLEDHIVVQGRTTSTQKIASYLLLMSRRLQQDQALAVNLPMSRYDIADHIGIAVETVSRAITELRRQGVIELETPRCVSIRNARKLADGIWPDAS
jgi:CRP-like cAMP-binding protein